MTSMLSFDLQRFAVYKVIPSASTPSGAAVQDPIQHFAVSDKTVTIYNRDFEGATDTANGKNGMVPAPTINDKDKFLKGDGTWATVSSGLSDCVIGSDTSTVEGGFWQDTINNVPVLKLRHGDYEYNFQYDSMSSVSNTSSSVITTAPNTYVLGTSASTVEGSVWYEVTNNVPTLKLHKGNFDYAFNYDSIVYKGNNNNLVAYLPFDISVTMDACGNQWTLTGNPTIQNGALYLNGSSFLVYTQTPFNNYYKWTVDFWWTPDVSLSGPLLNISDRYTLFFDHNTSSLKLTDYVNMSGQTIIEENHRYHIAFVFNGQDQLYVFVNGTLDMNSTVSGVYIYPPIYIGAGSQGRSFMTGSIDHFRIFTNQCTWTENFIPPIAVDYV